MLSVKTKTYTGGITMSQIHCNLKSRKNKHLNERERYKIEILLKEKMKASDIANRLGRSVFDILKVVH